MSYLSGSVLFLLIFIIFSIPASVIDIKLKRIPDWIVFPGIAVLFGLRVFCFGDPAIKILLEMIAGSLFFFGIRLFTKGKLGMGDVKFAALMGVFIGFPGWFIAAGLASFFGLLFAAAGMLSGRLDRNSRIPFAPFLTLGSIGAYFAAPILLKTITGVPA